MLKLKLRYKQPDGETSKLVIVSQSRTEDQEYSRFVARFSIRRVGRFVWYASTRFQVQRKRNLGFGSRACPRGNTRHSG